MRFLSTLLSAVILWVVGVIAYTIIATVWLNIIGDFGFSFRALIGIAGILAAINTSVAGNTSQR